MAGGTRVDSANKSRPLTPDMFERQPPSNIDAEIGVIGSILLLPSVCDDIATLLRAEDFYDDANRRLFTQLQGMYDGGKKIDMTLLVEALKSNGDFQVIGGMGYLAKVSQAVSNAAHATYYAQIVRDKSTYRSLIQASTDILKDAYEESSDSRELLSRAEQRIFGILDGRGTNNLSTLNDILHQAMDRIDARLRGEHTTGGVDTGFKEFDALTGGLHNSELIILAARPSMGKTALAMNIAEYVAVECHAPALFISLEMSGIELADRLLCSAARVNGHRLRNGSLSAEDRRRLVEKANAMSESPLFVDDSPSRTMTEIAAAARRVLRQTGRLGLIVIDYLQLIEPDSSKDPRQEQVARIARRLKGLARELKVPVLCLAQLNRQAEESGNHRPRLNHLRESGAIEQDADVVMFVHREEYYHSGEERDQYAGQAEIIIAKQRNGPVGDVKLLFQKDFTRFVNPAPTQYEEFDQFNSRGSEGF